MRKASRSLPRVATNTLLLALGLLAARQVRAQFPTDQPTRLPALGRSAVSNDDSTALVVNPANLGFMPGAELRWTRAMLSRWPFPSRFCRWRLASGSTSYRRHEQRPSSSSANRMLATSG
jgi:hypothetical protein